MRRETELDVLGTLLRDRPRGTTAPRHHGTTADINDYTVAFWNGRELVWARLRDDESGLIEEEFLLDLEEWETVARDVETWLALPRYSACSELRGWLKSPRTESAPPTV
jgi:hypothetical protein